MSDEQDPQDGPGETPPLLRVVKGDPRPEELAALVAVVSAMSAAAAEADARAEQPRSAWSDPARRLRTPLPRGRGAWRASAFGR